MNHFNLPLPLNRFQQVGSHFLPAVATCAGYMGYPPGTLRVNLFRYLVL
jgi:hypothetical protein